MIFLRFIPNSAFCTPHSQMSFVLKNPPTGKRNSIANGGFQRSNRKISPNMPVNYSAFCTPHSTLSFVLKNVQLGKYSRLTGKVPFFLNMDCSLLYHQTKDMNYASQLTTILLIAFSTIIWKVASAIARENKVARVTDNTNNPSWPTDRGNNKEEVFSEPTFD